MTCSENKFQCPNGRCINDANVCDGQCDCLQSIDGDCADEMNCTAFYNKTDGMRIVYFFKGIESGDFLSLSNTSTT